MSDNDERLLQVAGTNELEVLVFKLGTLRFGVNVAKVREVIGLVAPIHIPRAHPSVVGVANLRGVVIPLVDLQLYFHPGQPSSGEHRLIIIMDYSDMLMGFIVDGVEQIFRLNWEKVEPVPAEQTTQHAAVTSICHIEDKLVLMIDFEKISLDIRGLSMEIDQTHRGTVDAARGAKRILLAEDSPTMRGFIHEILHKAGYDNVTLTANGAEAWAAIQQAGPEPYDLIISDIEMPQMDGMCLCRHIREDAQVKDTPVIIFSSLVSDETHRRMAAARADATVSKPQLAKLVEIVDEVLARSVAVA